MKITKKYRVVISTIVLAVFVLTAWGMFDTFAWFLRTWWLWSLIPASNPATIYYGYGYGDLWYGYGTWYGYISWEVLNDTNARYASGEQAWSTPASTVISSWSVNITLSTGTTVTVSWIVQPSLSSFPTPVYTTSIPAWFSESNSTIQWVVDLTFAGWAQFSSPVRIDIPVAWATSVYIKANHGAWFTLAWLTTDPTATCAAWLATPAYAGWAISVVWGYATIYTCSASTFAAYSTSAGWGGGWGGWSARSKDVCPNWDNSASYYDESCGNRKVIEITSEWEIENDLLTDNGYTQEFNDAYTFAKEKGITTMPSIQEADMEWKLLRSHMAKMMVNYAINVLWKTLDTSKACNFSDMTNQSDEMKEYATKACQLWLMGLDTDKFMPNGIVTRAQFGTVLSRMLFNTPESWTPYYLVHLNLLKEKWIITNDNPNLLEMRAYVMIMLMRAAQ